MGISTDLRAFLYIFVVCIWVSTKPRKSLFHNNEPSEVHFLLFTFKSCTRIVVRFLMRTLVFDIHLGFFDSCGEISAKQEGLFGPEGDRLNNTANFI